MARKSLIAIGNEAFQVLLLFSNGKTIKEIVKSTKKSPQAINDLKNNLLNDGWIVKTARAKYELTNAGELFLKTIYLNEKIVDKLQTISQCLSDKQLKFKRLKEKTQNEM